MAAPATPPKATAAAPSATAPPPRAPLVTCDARPVPASSPRAAPASEPAAAAPSVEAARKATAEKALRRVPEIQKAVVKLRELPLRKPVPAKYQSARDFRAYVDREVSEQSPPEARKDAGRAYHHLGLFAKALDLDEMVTQTMASQVGAYYDPHEGKFFVVMAMGEDLMFDTLVAHELTHAIQDQHFGLLGYYGSPKDGPRKKLGSDELHARRFVVEGEASLMMMAYPLHAKKGVNLLEAGQRDLARRVLQSLADLDAEKLREMTRGQMAQMGDASEDVQRALEAMDDIPPYVLMPLLGAYLQGTLPVYEMYAARGWQGVAELYAHPPESTEQVLHPVEKLVNARDTPVKLSLPQAPSGARELLRDTLGELGWRSYFETWCKNDLDVAAAGWDGDTVSVHEAGTSKLGIAATTWDTEQDAAEFLDAYAGTLAARFPGSKVDLGSDRAQVARGDGTLVVVERRGQDVLIVDGATGADQIALAAPVSRE